MDGQLLTIGVARRCVAVLEDHHEVATRPTRQHYRIRPLVKVAVARAASRIVEVAEEAQRAVAADLLRRRPGAPVVSRHGTIDWRAAEARWKAPEVEHRPGHVHVVSVGALRIDVRGSERLVV